MEGLTDEDVAEITGLRAGTVRVRLHRARLFVRKELMKAWKPHAGRNAALATQRTSADEPKPARCKAMFAELSNYLDEQLDDSLCEELEKHLDGCGPCQVFLASLQATIEQCRRAPAESASGRTAVRLRKELLKNYARVVATVRP
jgi:RNA polymerase sigma-70 factor (ECF subfamily)